MYSSSHQGRGKKEAETACKRPQTPPARRATDPRPCAPLACQGPSSVPRRGSPGQQSWGREGAAGEGVGEVTAPGFSSSLGGRGGEPCAVPAGVLLQAPRSWVRRTREWALCSMSCQLGRSKGLASLLCSRPYVGALCVHRATLHGNAFITMFFVCCAHPPRPLAQVKVPITALVSVASRILHVDGLPPPTSSSSLTPLPRSSPPLHPPAPPTPPTSPCSAPSCPTSTPLRCNSSASF